MHFFFHGYYSSVRFETYLDKKRILFGESKVKLLKSWYDEATQSFELEATLPEFSNDWDLPAGLSKLTAACFYSVNQGRDFLDSSQKIDYLLEDVIIGEADTKLVHIGLGSKISIPCRHLDPRQTIQYAFVIQVLII